MTHDDLSFGEALLALQAGKRVARAGWNGKNMWVALTPASEVPFTNELRGAARLYANEMLEKMKGGALPDRTSIIRIGAHIDMRAADGSLVIGWLASQTDMLAHDWRILEAA